MGDQVSCSGNGENLSKLIPKIEKHFDQIIKLDYPFDPNPARRASPLLSLITDINSVFGKEKKKTITTAEGPAKACKNII